MKLTLITAWYNLKSKFDINTYREWMSNLLNNVCNFNLVIYTNKESFYVIEPFFNNKNIKIIFKEFDEFVSSKYDWKKNHEKNNLLNSKSRFKIDFKLNMLWNEKINFVKEVIDKQIFDTEWYGWCDIGYFRSNDVSTIKEWPRDEKINMLDKNKIYYALINNNSNYINQLFRMIIDKNDIGLPRIPIPPNQLSVAGGFFLINKTKINYWFKTFYDKLSLYFNNDYLVKDDQIIIANCVFENIEHFSLQRENLKQFDNWFMFQRILL